MGIDSHGLSAEPVIYCGSKSQDEELLLISERFGTIG
jgi:hypothetical protein